MRKPPSLWQFVMAGLANEHSLGLQLTTSGGVSRGRVFSQGLIHIGKAKKTTKQMLIYMFGRRTARMATIYEALL